MRERRSLHRRDQTAVDSASEAYDLHAGYDHLVELFERSRREFAARRLFGVKQTGGWEWLDYARVGKLVDRFRAGLAQRGIEHGDRVAIIADNRVEWAVACYATFGLGAVFVPMYQAQLAREWQFILGDCEAKCVIGATEEIVAQLHEIQREVPTLEHVIGLERPPADESSYSALLERGGRMPLPSSNPAPGDTACLIYTSGTTGMPKGVILSHGNIVSNINAMRELLPFVEEERSLAFLPWTHAFGQVCELHALVSIGGAIAINDSIPNLVANLAEAKPTLLFAVPRVFNRVYAGVNEQIGERPGVIRALFRRGVDIAKRGAGGAKTGLFERAVHALADRLIFTAVRQRFGGRLRYAVSGSAALNREVAELIDAIGVEVYEGYGLTEASPIVSANYPGHRKMGSVGKPIPGVTVRIDHSVVDDPLEGEVVVYGPNVMQGYRNRPEDSRAALMADGGLRTGDLGHLDADGYLYIAGRIKEQYKLDTGNYVAPAPLEETLKLSPFIANALVHGENRPYNVALVVPELNALRHWAHNNGYQLGDVTHDPRVRELIGGELDRLSADFKSFERVKQFALTSEDFTTENGMLTPTLKPKRRAILLKYAAALDALY
ncbi:MAG: long-chain fatty acid--CoA ligase [bacterium]